MLLTPRPTPCSFVLHCGTAAVAAAGGAVAAAAALPLLRCCFYMLLTTMLRVMCCVARVCRLYREAQGQPSHGNSYRGVLQGDRKRIAVDSVRDTGGGIAREGTPSPFASTAASALVGFVLLLTLPNVARKCVVSSHAGLQ